MQAHYATDYTSRIIQPGLCSPLEEGCNSVTSSGQSRPLATGRDQPTVSAIYRAPGCIRICNAYFRAGSDASVARKTRLLALLVVLISAGRHTLFTPRGIYHEIHGRR